uniref:Uncharacterized protein n=1 Tax=Rhizophora mucronata TaxID=61149 RepID=A0A2P2QI89_RHIMU
MGPEKNLYYHRHRFITLRRFKDKNTVFYCFTPAEMRKCVRQA